jgi:hypothetical protein
MTKLDENGRAEIVIPICEWCLEPLVIGPSKNGIHEACVEEMNAATEQAYDKLASGWIGPGRKDG